MGVSLSKGQKVNLSKVAAGLKKAMVGLGWDENAYDGASFDLDASAFLLNASGKCRNDLDFVFYGNLEHPTGAVKHMGDNLTGQGEGDDEQIEIYLPDIPADVEKIAFVVTIYDAERKRQNFGQVENAYIRIVDEETGKEVLRFDLTEDYSSETGLVFGELYRKNGDWKFSAVGSGYEGGLAAICARYGIDADGE